MVGLVVESSGLVAPSCSSVLAAVSPTWSVPESGGGENDPPQEKKKVLLWKKVIGLVGIVLHYFSAPV